MCKAISSSHLVCSVPSAQGNNSGPLWQPPDYPACKHTSVCLSSHNHVWPSAIHNRDVFTVLATYVHGALSVPVLLQHSLCMYNNPVQHVWQRSLNTSFCEICLSYSACGNAESDRLPYKVTVRSISAVLKLIQRVTDSHDKRKHFVWSDSFCLSGWLEMEREKAMEEERMQNELMQRKKIEKERKRGTGQTERGGRAEEAWRRRRGRCVYVNTQERKRHTHHINSNKPHHHTMCQLVSHGCLLYIVPEVPTMDRTSCILQGYLLSWLTSCHCVSLFLVIAITLVVLRPFSALWRGIYHRWWGCRRWTSEDWQTRQSKQM